MRLKTTRCGCPPTPTGKCRRHSVGPPPRGNAFAATRLRVAERDGWICQLCFEPIDPALRKPHPRALNVHHVRGRANGGRDSDDNYVASHAICNQEAGSPE